jgi:hypothetical protein
MLEFLLNEKNIYWIISIVITFVWYYIYIKDIFYWENKPHFYSWIVWWIITMIIYFIQVKSNSGAGSWVTLFSWIMSLFIAIISFFRFRNNITTSDTVSLILAFV